MARTREMCSALCTHQRFYASEANHKLTFLVFFLSLSRNSVTCNLASLFFVIAAHAIFVLSAWIKKKLELCKSENYGNAEKRGINLAFKLFFFGFDIVHVLVNLRQDRTTSRHSETSWKISHVRRGVCRETAQRWTHARCAAGLISAQKKKKQNILMKIIVINNLTLFPESKDVRRKFKDGARCRSGCGPICPLRGLNLHANLHLRFRILL